jgi:hypothetical protein
VRPAHPPASFSFDLSRLKPADYALPGGTLLFFVLAFFPWLSFGDEFFGIQLSGWELGQVTSAFVLFLLATAWALLPAFVDMTVGFPRSWITVGLVGLGWLFTLFAWLDALDAGFSVWPLLGLLTATALLVVAVLALTAEVRAAPATRPSTAAPWPGPPAQGFGQAYPQSPYGPGGPVQGSGGQGQPVQPYGQQPPPPTPPAPPGGSTASGEGTGTPGPDGRSTP